MKLKKERIPKEKPEKIKKEKKIRMPKAETLADHKVERKPYAPHPTLRFIALFLAVLLPLLPILYVTMGREGDTYGETFLGELKYKYERLVETNDPKIVVVGGSSVAFGLNSEMLSQYTGYEVVNFGLYASLGTRVMLDLSRANINKGDIVILAPELDKQTLSMYFNAESVWQALDSDLSMLKNIDPDNYGDLVGGFFDYASQVMTYAAKGTKPSTSGVYTRESFNEYGDIIYPRPHNVLTKGYDSNQIVSLTPDLFDKEFLAYLNEYIAWMKDQGATVYFSFCPVNASAAAEDTTEESLAEFYRFVLENVRCPVISSPEDLLMDEDYFFDTNFHLNDAGVTVRTANLISDLYRLEGKTVSHGIELPPPPERPTTEDPSTWVENEWSELFLYRDDGPFLTITGVTEKGREMTSLEIPFKANGKTVRVIGENAFRDCAKLEEIIVYDNITEIENGAFAGADAMKRLVLHHHDEEGLMVSQEGHLFRDAPDALKIYFDSEEIYFEFLSGYWWSAYGDRMVAP